MDFTFSSSDGRPVLNQQALRESFKHKTISGSARDVYESEPPDDLEFLALPNLMVTPHIGGSANEAVLAMGRSAISHIREYFLD